MKDHAVPAARLLILAARHWTRTRRSRATENEFQTVNRDLSEGRRRLVIQLETKLFCVERDSPIDIPNLVPDAPELQHETLDCLYRLFVMLIHRASPSIGFIPPPGVAHGLTRGWA